MGAVGCQSQPPSSISHHSSMNTAGERAAHGFSRTRCACAFCKVYCRHMPGTLDPSDLSRLGPGEPEVFAWAEQHLRALVGQSYPALVPARGPDGHCHWYFDGKCAVHADAPFGCAFFDAHMPDAEVGRRVAATVRACEEDAAAQGLYHRVWLHLQSKGLLAPHGDRSVLRRELQLVARAAERHRRRAGDESG